MLRLSLKDLKINKAAFLINMAFWTILGPGWITLNLDIYLIMPVICTLFVVIIPMSAELRDNMDILYNSLPIKRKTIIISRYISSLAMIILIYAWMLLIGFLMDEYLSVIKVDLIEKISAGTILLILLPVFLLICIYIPIVLRFGFSVLISSGIIVFIGVFSGFFTGISYIISANGPLVGYLGPDKMAGMIGIIMSNNLFYYISVIIKAYGTGIPVAIILSIISLAVYLSINISISIYKRKEL